VKLVSRKVVFKYLYNQLTGNFAGFLIGISATGLVSHFFETRSFKNLWGLTSKKTVVDKDTFSNIEWIISIVIGFIAFEIFIKVIKERLDKNLPIYKFKFLRWIVTNGWHSKMRTMNSNISQKRIVFIASMNTSLRNTINKYSKR
jgi:hypothetical protein